MQEAKLIGVTVISTNFGPGKVTSIETMGDRDRRFLVIESESSQVKNFIPIEDKDSYRMIATQSKANEIIAEMKTRKNTKPPYFESKKDRIDYFKTNSKIQDIDLLSKLIIELSQLTDKGSAEIQIFNKILDSISLEFSLSINKNQVTTKEIIMDALKED